MVFKESERMRCLSGGFTEEGGVLTKSGRLPKILVVEEGGEDS